MYRVSKRVSIWVVLTFLLLFFLVSALLMPHSPILDLGGTQCASSRKDKTSKPRDAFGNDFAVCPDVKFPSEGTNKGWPIFRKALERYAKFHKTKLKQLKQSFLGEGVKTLTWTCSQAKCSGLGDQLFRIQYFLLLAMMSDRLFTVHWDEALDRSARYLIPNEMNWNYFDLSKGMCTDKDLVFSTNNCSKNTFDITSMWGFGWTKEEFAHFGDMLFSSEQHITVTGRVVADVMFINKDSIMDPGKKITAGFEKLGLNDILVEQHSNETVRCGHNPLWYSMLHKFGAHHIMEIPEISSGRVVATEPWMQVSHVIFCYLFKFPQVLITEVDRVSRSLGIDDNKYVAVHLRTGFKGMPYEESYITRWIHRNWKFFEDTYVWDGIVAHGFELADRMLGPQSFVYLCTDTDVAKERYQKKYGDRLKIADLSLTHSAHSRSKCESQDATSTEDTKQTLETTEAEQTPETPSLYDDPYVSMWIDFFLLGRAHAMVHGDSSYSVNAAFLRPMPNLYQAWVMFDDNRKCIASHLGGNSTCIIMY